MFDTFLMFCIIKINFEFSYGESSEKPCIHELQTHKFSSPKVWQSLTKNLHFYHILLSCFSFYIHQTNYKYK